jgi:lipoprotein-anchoring transpeptidase ErfK/SrfK
VLIAGCQIGTVGVTNNDSSTPEAEGPRAIIQSTVISATTPQPQGTEGALIPVSESNATATATPSPTPTVILPDRSDCASIQGTQYRSDDERDFYLANCLPTPEPTEPPVDAPSPPAIPGPEVQGERWILVDLASQTTTAMIGNTPLYTALVSTGKEGWETPTGNWQILYRVEDETMTSASIGADEYYVLDHVLYTQYFTNVGHALHLNYWRDDSYFGHTPSSHGCVGMRLADAEFFWNFAKVGTRVTVQ